MRNVFLILGCILSCGGFLQIFQMIISQDDEKAQLVLIKQLREELRANDLGKAGVSFTEYAYAENRRHNRARAFSVALSAMSAGIVILIVLLYFK